MSVCVLSRSFGDLLSFTLTAFVELMDHGIVSWDTFSVAFIKKVSQAKTFNDRAVLLLCICSHTKVITASLINTRLGVGSIFSAHMHYLFLTICYLMKV